MADVMRSSVERKKVSNSTYNYSYRRRKFCANAGKKIDKISIISPTLSASAIFLHYLEIRSTAEIFSILI